MPIKPIVGEGSEKDSLNCSALFNAIFLVTIEAIECIYVNIVSCCVFEFIVNADVTERFVLLMILLIVLI